MKVVILGAGGQLAFDLVRVMADWDLVPLRHEDLDTCDYPRVREVLRGIRPDAVINTAAFVRVDDCEDQVERAFQVNAFAVRNLAQVCADLDCVLMHISSDYVFGGEKRTPYTEEDLPNPVNVYGSSKLAGEYFVRNICPKHFVARTSGLYGVAGSSGKGGNFVETMIRMAKEGNPIRVVNDQVLSPTYSRDLAEELNGLLATTDYGLYHVTNNGACSWYGFAAKIFELVGLRPDLAQITTQAYASSALRPAYSALAHSKPLIPATSHMRPWENALSAYLQEKGWL